MSLGVNPRAVKWLWTPWARWIWCLDLKWEILRKKWGFLMKVYKGLVCESCFFQLKIFVCKRFWFASWNLSILSEYSQCEDSKSSDIILYDDDSLREIAEVDDVRIVRSRFEIKEALGPDLKKVAWQTQKGGSAKVRKSWLLSLPHFQMPHNNDVKVNLEPSFT